MRTVGSSQLQAYAFFYCSNWWISYAFYDRIHIILHQSILPPKVVMGIMLMVKHKRAFLLFTYTYIHQSQPTYLSRTLLPVVSSGHRYLILYMCDKLVGTSLFLARVKIKTKGSLPSSNPSCLIIIMIASLTLCCCYNGYRTSVHVDIVICN